MDVGTILAIVLGAGLSLMSTVWGVRTARRAMRLPMPAFMRAVFAGMGIRVLVVLVAVVGVLLVLPVSVPLFVGVLVGTYIVGLIVEVALLQHGASHASKLSE